MDSRTPAFDDLNLDEETIALRQSNHDRLSALASRGMPLDLRIPYLMALMEAIALERGVLGSAVTRHERNVASILDDAERQAHEAEQHQRRQKLLGGAPRPIR